MNLLPESKALKIVMLDAGYPYCLGKGDWCGKKPRHCNSCIKHYRRMLAITK